jgi:hypothetical protein
MTTCVLRHRLATDSLCGVSLGSASIVGGEELKYGGLADTPQFTRDA